MISDTDGLPLKKFIEHFLQEIARADSQAQILQQTGWLEFQRSFKKTESIDITEGIGQLEYLGLREIKMSFSVEPVQYGFWQRLKRIIRYLFGKPGAPAMQQSRLVPGTQGISAFLITLTVARSEDGSFSLKSEPDTEQLGGVYVADIIT